ncbi:MAG TPA: carboxyl transferase domain-containing protein, partial [Promineifilum sp.]|nr:carboxyl transferase domain-containing protein [Promineifilum sp.]
MTKDMEFYLQDLRARRAAAMGNEKDVAAQHGKKRLTARERLDLLFDPGTFTEIDTLVLPRHENYPGGKQSRLGDGVVTGFGLVNGRRVFAASQDAAV